MLEAKRNLERQVAGLQRANEDRSKELERVRHGTIPTTTEPKTQTKPAMKAEMNSEDSAKADELKADVVAEVSQQRAKNELAANGLQAGSKFWVSPRSTSKKGFRRLSVMDVRFIVHQSLLLQQKYTYVKDQFNAVS